MPGLDPVFHGLGEMLAIDPYTSTGKKQVQGIPKIYVHIFSLQKGSTLVPKGGHSG